MKKLLALLVMVVVLGVCAPSYGYILVYKVTGKVKAFEWNEPSYGNVAVKGFLVIDIQDTGDDEDNDANNARLVLYGKDADGDLVYFNDALGDGGNIEWFTTGEFVGLEVWDSVSPFEYEFTMTGKVKLADVGFGVEDKRLVSSSLKGTLGSWWGMLLDETQELFGSGSASMTLDTAKTKAANQGALNVDAVTTDIIEGDGGLEEKGYNELI